MDMKNSVLSLLGLLTFAFGLQAQDLDYSDYNWDSDPQYQAVEADEEDHEIVLKDKRVVEYAYSDKGFFQYYLQHQSFSSTAKRPLKPTIKFTFPVLQTTSFSKNRPAPLRQMER